MSTPTGRFHLAFDDPTLEPDPVWTRIDEGLDCRVAWYSIDRGRQFELDRTDTGRATVFVNDPAGVLDPTNAGGAFFGKLEPLLQAHLGRRNPVTGEWFTRFRGFVDDFDYDFDRSQRVNRLTVRLVSMFEILAAVEMLPGEFGIEPAADEAGNVVFAEENVDDRILGILGGAGIPSELATVFSGNVVLRRTVYSPGETALTAIQEAADGEFPGVANVYDDRLGRFAFHGRFAKFYPETVAASAAGWDFQSWKVGDGAAVNVSPSDTAQIREFAFNRGLSQIRNSASAWPFGAEQADIDGQTVKDDTSIGLRGIRSWSAPNLLTLESLIDSADGLLETRRFALWVVSNFAEARNRITLLAVRSVRPERAGAAATWDFLCRADISDRIRVTVGSPGGGGFSDDAHFIEGLHEEARPLGTSDYDDVTVRVDASPAAFFVNDPWVL